MRPQFILLPLLDIWPALYRAVLFIFECLKNTAEQSVHIYIMMEIFIVTDSKLLWVRE